MPKSGNSRRHKVAKKKLQRRNQLRHARKFVGAGHTDKVTLEIFKMLRDKTPADVEIEQIRSMFQDYYQNLSFVEEISKDKAVLDVVGNMNPQLKETILDLNKTLEDIKSRYHVEVDKLKAIADRIALEYGGKADDIIRAEGLTHVETLEFIMDELIDLSEPASIAYHEVLRLQAKLSTLVAQQESEKHDTANNTEETPRSESEAISEERN